ncbi:MFS transporter [Tenggerimyces flavus]|uniref:MFS transporter n=1 Tax=Tenggerimyces flavus TaxID=1708749 RepID=A0ABV7YBG2_9ACTN|nr:MFS transporter [Tenggerimyces flavus]MBM7787167.1 EmrB/QacA subfamily drug resistance transporter [Tenggerimyces flavus]
MDTTTKPTTRRGWVLGVTSVASLMVALDLLVVSTALNTIRVDLGTSTELLQWTVTAYGLTFAALLMTGAALGDRFGRRRVVILGLAVFAAASASCALAPSIGWLIGARAVQGAGAALVMPLAVALLSAAFPAADRGRALGIFEGRTGLATIAGPPVGGVVAQMFGWEWIFWINVPIALVTIVLVRSRIDESHGPDAALDLRGLVLVTAGAIGLVWGLVNGNALGWSSPAVLVPLAAGVALLIAFVRWENRSPAPMLPLRLFRSRAFTAGTLASFLVFGALYGTVFFLGQFLQSGLGHSPMEAGIRLIPWTACLLVVAPLAGSIADRLGDRPVLVAGLALDAVGYAVIAFVASTTSSYGWLLLGLIVNGVGASMTIPVIQNVVMKAVDDGLLSKAAGANSTTQEVGGVFGVAVLVAVFTAVGSFASPALVVDGVVVALASCAALAALAFVAVLFVPKAAQNASA